MRAVLCCALRAYVGVFPSPCPVWDLLLSDMPPSAWLLIAPGLQESRTSGTDIADGDREHGAERSPLNRSYDHSRPHRDTTRGPDHRPTAQDRVRDTSRGHTGRSGPAQAGWSGGSLTEQLESHGYYLTCPQVGAQLHPAAPHRALTHHTAPHHHNPRLSQRVTEDTKMITTSMKRSSGGSHVFTTVFRGSGLLSPRFRVSVGIFLLQGYMRNSWKSWEYTRSTPYTSSVTADCVSVGWL